MNLRNKPVVVACIGGVNLVIIAAMMFLATTGWVVQEHTQKLVALVVASSSLVALLSIHYLIFVFLIHLVKRKSEDS